MTGKVSKSPFMLLRAASRRTCCVGAAHQRIDQGYDAAKALIGSTAGQEDVKGQGRGRFRCQRSVLRADW